MKPTIKELWSEYLQTKTEKYSEEKKKVKHRLSEISGEFVGSLSVLQNEKFEQYCDARNDLYSIEEYEAFERGVIFATRFILETGQ